MATEKTLITHSSDIGKMKCWLQRSIETIVANTVSMTVARVNIFTVATKKKLHNCLIPSLTKFVFSTRIPSNGNNYFAKEHLVAFIIQILTLSNY